MAKLNKNMFGHLAEVVQKNSKDEAEAIESYQQMLNEINGLLESRWMFEREVYENGESRKEETETAKADKKMLKFMLENVKEIIGDELNHQKRLDIIYKALTGIKAKED